MNKVQVQIEGLSEAKVAEDVYWLLFKEVDGGRHALILVGKAEAQAITVSLQKAQLPVKLTHQLFAEIVHRYGIQLREVVIMNDDDDRPFRARLLWGDAYDGDNAYETEARASDGVALALCCGVPIYMESGVLDRFGNLTTVRPSELTDDDLHDLLTKAIADENYEQAAQLRDEIKKRDQKNPPTA